VQSLDEADLVDHDPEDGERRQARQIPGGEEETALERGREREEKQGRRSRAQDSPRARRYRLDDDLRRPAHDTRGACMC
jgi:hypothetical protein